MKISCLLKFRNWTSMILEITFIKQQFTVYWMITIKKVPSLRRFYKRTNILS